MDCRLRFLSLAATVFWVVLSTCAWAQTASEQLDFVEWDALASRAEAAIDAGRASEDAFEDVREELVEYRRQFQAASQANQSRVDTLRSQLAALGPAPENGVEAPEVANRRDELNNQLSAVLAPRLVAQAALTEANGLIQEIDDLIDARRTDNLLELGPSPLNPAYWSEALEDVGHAYRALSNEMAFAWANPTNRAQVRDQLPLILVLLTGGMILIIRGRQWAENLGNYMRRFGLRGTGVWSFVVSLGRIVIPIFGLFLVIEATLQTGMLGPRGAQIVDNVPSWGAVLLVLRWLCERLFSKRDEDALIPFAGERRTELRLYGTLLAFLYVGTDILRELAAIANADPETRVVLAFPVILFTALILFRMGQILARGPVKNSTDSHVIETATSSGALIRILQWMGWGSLFVAVVAPVLAAIGYFQLSISILFPTVFSLALLGLVVVLQRFVEDIYALVSGKGEQARESLLPALIGFLLVLASLPIHALIWGARPEEILDLWNRFNEGFSIGEATISPSDFLAFAIFFVIGYIATRIIQNTLKTTILPKTRLDPGGQNAVVSGVGYVGIFLAAMLAITGAGIDLSALAFVAGALSVGIGFGLQNIVQNFVSGIILLIERPIAEGDWIEVNGQMGYVRDISVRSTRIETFDRTDVIVPNADFVSGTVTNYTRGNTVGRVIVPVGVAYGSDTQKVSDILKEIAEQHPMVLATPPPSVVFQGFGADSLDFEIRAILRDVNWVLSVKSKMNHDIARRFQEEGIEIPFAQRDVWLRNPEVLNTGGRPASSEELPANDGRSTPEIPNDDTDQDSEA